MGSDITPKDLELICDGCFRPITSKQSRIYRGWRFTGTPWSPPRQGDTTHVISECQQAYVARRLHGRPPRGWSKARIARAYGVSWHKVNRWIGQVR